MLLQVIQVRQSYPSTPRVSFIQIWKSSLTTPPACHQFQTPAEKVILAASRTH